MNLSRSHVRGNLARLSLLAIGVLSNSTLSQAAPQANGWKVLHTGTDQFLYGSHFVDDRHGRVVGWGGVTNQAIICSTQDAGESWTREHAMPGDQLFDVASLDEWVLAVGQRANQGLVLRSQDNGANYTPTSISASFGLYAVEILGPGVAIASGYNGAILKTVDGGANWVAMTTPFPSSVYRSLSFANDQVGYALGGSAFQGKRVIRTADGGQTWVAMQTFVAPHVYSDLAAIDSGPAAGRRVVVAGYDGSDQALQTSTDGGLTWSNTLTQPGVTVLQSIGFRGEVGWAGGVTSFVQRSSDGGLTWTAHPTPAPFIGAISVTDGAVYLAGDNGRVFRRRD